MNESTELSPNRCPGCHDPVETTWAVCPYCGLRLKPGGSLLPRLLGWLAVLTAFSLGEVAIAMHDANLAAGYGLLFGIPLSYVFGKAVLFRIYGRPMTLGQLGQTGVRATLLTWLLLVVIPVVIGLAIVIFLFIVCSGMFVTGR